MRNEVYIHWGTDRFEKEKFKPVYGISFMNKPTGGFWACEEHDLQWNESEFCYVKQEIAELDKCVKFRLKETADILIINSLEKVQELCRDYPHEISPLLAEIYHMDCFIDWHEIAKRYDAVIFRNIGSYHHHCYGVDLDSICVCNPDSIIVL